MPEGSGVVQDQTPVFLFSFMSATGQFAAAAKHYDEAALAALLTHVAVINVWNRLNVATAQQAGEWTAQWVSQEG